MAKSNYSALGLGESTLHEKGKMGSKSEFISEKGFGPVSKIRSALRHWLCFDWIPRFDVFSLFPSLILSLPCVPSPAK